MKKIKRVQNRDGVILLLVVIILTAIFSISVGVFSVIIGQVSTSETFESSYLALFAADQSIERTLYRDRAEGDFPTGTTIVLPVEISPGVCMSTTTVVKILLPQSTTITAAGINAPCGTISARTTARAFQTTY